MIGQRQALVALTLCVLVFAILCLLVLRGATEAVDRRLVLALRTPGDLGAGLGPAWWGRFLVDVTNAGGRSILGLFGLLAAGYLAVLRRWRELAVLAAALLGGSELSGVTKELIGRIRPDVVPHLAQESSASFPSGHATYSALAYVTFATLLAPLAPTGAARLYLAGAAGLIVLLIGFSRVWLGVHYPTDVLGGWSLGCAWALGCWLAVERLAPR